MLILSIETSCDETAVSIVRADGEFPEAEYEVLGNALHSQADMHAEYGGVFPTLAKREHTKNLVPMLHAALAEAELLESDATDLASATEDTVRTYLERETELADAFIAWLSEHHLPEIDLIAVTNGPGLEPALWVGVNFAKALAAVSGAPVVPVDHMEGHVLASVFDAVDDNVLAPVDFPAISLLISGGHTELLLLRDWTSYERVGCTRDDAVGEAFDKIARLLGLPYPGGPEIERRAADARRRKLPPYKADIPRPMLHSGDLDFSFSGLKTSVRYAVADVTLSEDEISALARDVSDAIADVLLRKTQMALEQYGASTLIVGGGVSASRFLREQFTATLATAYPDVTLYFPRSDLATDNSVMIALSGHAHAREARSGASVGRIKADGNRSLGQPDRA